ncbi:MAG: thioredoxin domain-containing protein [Desulfobacteraceae bacterium]|nr:thioredoxin domain-containing protein [Desulfobacteraceae bacterium]
MRLRKFLGIIGIALVVFGPVAVGCSESTTQSGAGGKSVVAALDGAEAFRQALADAGTGLVVVDFYADWCAPCRQLSPMLEEIARAHPDKATFYKVNVDQNGDLMRVFRITGIPHVMFFRNSQTVHSIIGVQHKDAYVNALNRL